MSSTTSSADRFPLATRVNSFRRAGLDVVDAIRAIGRIPAMGAVELNFPQHVGGLADGALAAVLGETGLRLTALNLRFEGEAFLDGAFTSPRPEIRDRAVDLARKAVESAARHGAAHVVLWMESDGYDYPFQVDYGRLWEWEIGGFRRVAESDPAVRVSVEYKPSDPRRFALIRTMGDALLAAREVGLPSFGVTLDLCHGLMTGEHPAAAAAMALREGRLFGVHLNDGAGWADDGLMVGSVRPWHLLELLAVLRDGGYGGTLYFDTFPVREDPAAECAVNARAVRRCERLLDRLDPLTMAEVRDRQDAVAARRMLDDLVFGDGA